MARTPTPPSALYPQTEGNQWLADCRPAALEGPGVAPPGEGRPAGRPEHFPPISRHEKSAKWTREIPDSDSPRRASKVGGVANRGSAPENPDSGVHFGDFSCLEG